MSIFTAKDPIARIQKVIAEKKLGWLWAVKSRWDSTDTIKLSAMSKDSLEWWLPQNYETCTNFCYVHLVSDHHEQVIRLDFDRMNCQWLDALQKLREAESLMFVQHLVSISTIGDAVKVWSAPKGTTFTEMFMQHPRSKV